MLNRVALIVRPRQPYADWANSMLDGGVDFDLEQHRNEPEVFLLPESACENLPAALKKHWKAIFEHQLWAWWTDKSAWPRKRTQAMFRAWFEVGLAEPVWDLGDGELEAE